MSPLAREVGSPGGPGPGGLRWPPAASAAWAGLTTANEHDLVYVLQKSFKEGLIVTGCRREAALQLCLAGVHTSAPSAPWQLRLGGVGAPPPATPNHRPGVGRLWPQLHREGGTTACPLTGTAQESVILVSPEQGWGRRRPGDRRDAGPPGPIR